MPKFSTEQEYNGYLKVNSCGKQWLNNRDHDTLRPEGRIDYSLYYLLKGNGYYEVDGEKFIAPEGSLIFYSPKEKQHYFFKMADNPIMLWSHFSGTACDILKETITANVATVKIFDRKQFESVFEKMILAYRKSGKYFDTACAGYMTVLISLIAQSVQPATQISTRVSNENLEKVLSHIHLNFANPIDIKEYAKICCISQEHFIRVFKAYTGMPPYHYQLQLRIKHAITMLENTSASVKECAEMVGFTDTTYFSKIFKRFTGMPPSHYKKQIYAKKQQGLHKIVLVAFILNLPINL